MIKRKNDLYSTSVLEKVRPNCDHMFAIFFVTVPVKDCNFGKNIGGTLGPSLEVIFRSPLSNLLGDADDSAIILKQTDTTFITGYNFTASADSAIHHSVNFERNS